ncbi:BolA-like protein 2 [Trebouxia sp. C0009 RCD-2024]
MVTAAEVEQALKQRLEAKDVTVVDDSGGCGSSFTVAVVSDQFEGKKLLDRHKLVNAALKEELKDIHALSVKKCWTIGQQAAAQKA